MVLRGDIVIVVVSVRWLELNSFGWLTEEATFLHDMYLQKCVPDIYLFDSALLSSMFAVAHIDEDYTLFFPSSSFLKA